MRSGSNAKRSRFSRLGEVSGRSMRRYYGAAAAHSNGVGQPLQTDVRAKPARPENGTVSGASAQPLRVSRQVLLRAAQVFRRIDGEPKALVPEGPEPSVGRQLGKRRRLVVTPLRQAFERLLPEDIHTAAHPRRHPAALAEAAHDVLLIELDDPERRRRPRHHDRRGRAGLAVTSQHLAQIAVEQLVPVQRVDVALLAALLRGKADASASPERLRLLGDRELRTAAREHALEELAAPGAAAHDHTRDACQDEQAELVGEQRPARDLDERLRPAARGVAEPLGLAAGKDDCFHGYASSSASSSSCADARPIPSYVKPAARTASGSRRLRPSMISGRRIASRISGDAIPRNSSHSVTITAASAPVTASTALEEIATPWSSSRGSAAGS